MNVKIGLQLIGVAKKRYRKQRSSQNPIIKIIIPVLDFLWKSITFVKRICIDENFRSIFRMQLLNSKNVHQTTSLTYMDRYPDIFSACREYFKDKQDLKILSYGCSTGEEVITLRKYFPHAHIVGAEINKTSLAKCRQLPVDDKITFIYSKDHEISKYGPYDAIFCMAVLQRKPHYIEQKGISSLKDIYPFEKFEQQIMKLDEYTKLKGLLVVHFTQYSLRDTMVCSKYEALGDYNQNDYLSPVFDKNSEIIISPPPQSSIFIKVNN
ncbi:trans-aconitate 2-methyltransferase [Ammoniphilus sp. YIM 78166]|uniref:class I SAM-dependent methyltransferase n=1 Tax=Ammoniphilus sp. YIM 78166 TaxID=1644106 RepID=UPI0010700132|nr:methyltransferase domain-containing protein [Ammoniphilus sp. YIM 78166]